MDLSNHVKDEWDDLIYDISRGKFDKVKNEVIMNQSFHTLAILTEGGDQILHVCAHHGHIQMFEWFVLRYQACVTSLNLCQETPLMVACREGKMDIVKLYKTTYTHHNRFNINA